MQSSPYRKDPTNPRSYANQGFTLTELMVVVAIVGILAVIGVALLREYVFSSKAIEVSTTVQAIRAAEERWRAENQTYLNVTSDGGGWYPMTEPGKELYAWERPSHQDFQRWKLLNPSVSGSVQFGYRVNAGLPGVNLTQPEGIETGWAATTPDEPWYVIQALADQDDDGIKCRAVASSSSGGIHIINEGE